MADDLGAPHVHRGILNTSGVSWFLGLRSGYGSRHASLAALTLALFSSAWALSPPGLKKLLHIFFVNVDGGTIHVRRGLNH